MSEKTMELMKKALEKKKQQQSNDNKHRPTKKIGHAQKGHNNQKIGGSNNKVQ